MCIAMFRWSPASGDRLFFALNRDEFFSRASAELQWTSAIVLSGIDQVAGGTWFGVTRSGRMACVTNIRAPRGDALPNLRSRGELTHAFLHGHDRAEDYLHRVARNAGDYGGFNLLCGEIAGPNPTLWFLNARESSPRALTAGDYVLSNATLNTPWPKTEKLRGMLPNAVRDRSNQTALAAMLDSERAHPTLLPNTGVPLDWEHALSAVLIREGASRGYGTRSTTLLRASESHAHIHEYTHTEQRVAASAIEFEFPFSGHTL